ncbi:MAG: AAA family ATPase [Gemmataceae bacterium]|nr:AAA family ATPase [Gemmataceae bacterium]
MTDRAVLEAKAAEIERTLRVFCVPGQVFSVQVLYGPRNAKSFVTGDIAEAVRVALHFDETRPIGVYFTPNPVRPDWAGSTAFPKDEQIVERYWLLIDCDPIRPSGTSSTEAEAAASWRVLDGCRSLLDGAGLVGTVVAFSGGGWHLCYPVLLPNDAAAKELIRSVLRHLQEQYGAKATKEEDALLKVGQPLPIPKASVDTSCHDAKRIWPVYGTWKRKGQDSPERPHRLTYIVPEQGLYPEPWDRETAESNTLILRGLPAKWKREDELRQGTAQLNIDTYVKAAVQAEVQAVTNAPVGERNTQLNKSSFNLGTLIGAGVLSAADAGTTLLNAALAVGLTAEESRATIRSGLNAGTLKPRDLTHVVSQQPTKPPIDTTQTLIDRACDITPRIVEWVWPGVIPLGKLTTFAGIGGLGKTFVLCDITARITTGTVWPFSGSTIAPRGQVLFISGEDDPDDTLVPRLIEMRADLEQVTFLKASIQDRFTLADLDVLKKALEQTGADVRMVVIDPPTAYLGGVDDHKNSELRGLLSPLAHLAHEHRIAVIFNTHVNKQAGKVEAMMRVMGSVAWVNAVRAAHLFVRDSEDPNRRLFLPMKMNLAKERMGLAYEIVTAGQLARVNWVGEVDVTADEAVGNGHATPKQKAAAEWLIEKFCEKRAWPSIDLFNAGKSEGISRDGIFAAKRSLNLPKPRQEVAQDGTRSWVWWVPDDWPPLSTPKDSATEGSNGYPT